jgi:hypothetical protein
MITPRSEGGSYGDSSGGSQGSVLQQGGGYGSGSGGGASSGQGKPKYATSEKGQGDHGYIDTSMTMAATSTMEGYGGMATAMNTYSTPAYGSGSYGGGDSGPGYQNCMQSEFVRFCQRRHANTSIQCVLHLMVLLQWHLLRGPLLPPRLLQRVVLVAYTLLLLLLPRAFCVMCLSPSMHLLVTPSHLSGMPISTLSQSHPNWL